MNVFGRFFRPSPRSTSLDQSISKGLDWLCGMLACFEIHATRGTLPEGGSELPWRIKPLGELIFLLLILEGHQRDEPQLVRLKQFAADRASHFDWHMLAANDPSAASPVATIEYFFSNEGLRSPIERDYLSMLIDVGYFDGMDRLAYRSMDLIHGFWKIGRPEGLQDLQSNFQNTAFGRRQLISRYTIDDIYSLTHALFYITDLGRRDPMRVLDAAEFARLRRDLIALTAVMMRADNFDVLGELLICWSFCKLELSEKEKALFRHGISIGRSMQGAHGSFASTRAQLALSDANPSSFLALYHTTLVAIILFSVTGDWI